MSNHRTIRGTHTGGTVSTAGVRRESRHAENGNNCNGTDKIDADHSSDPSAIPSADDSSSSKTNKKPTREEMENEMRRKRYADIVTQFHAQTLDVSKQLQNYEESEESFLTKQYKDLLDNTHVNVDIFDGVGRSSVAEKSEATSPSPCDEVGDTTVTVIVPFLNTKIQRPEAIEN